jgi:hypothetical protein
MYLKYSHICAFSYFLVEVVVFDLFGCGWMAKKLVGWFAEGLFIYVGGRTSHCELWKSADFIGTDR